jgi:[NiFe] hydrogenase diaphorase moiety large subunit
MKEEILPRWRLLDEIWSIQDAQGYLDDKALAGLAGRFGTSEADIEGVVSFYHFFRRKPAGRHSVYLDNSIISDHAGYGAVRQAFEQATGTAWGTTRSDGLFGLFDTPCIGLSDQAPAALIGFHPFTRLTPDKVRLVVGELLRGKSAAASCDTPDPNIRYTPGERTLLLRAHREGSALSRLNDLRPPDVLAQIQAAGLGGMGGAFFPTGRKWSLCSGFPGRRQVVCNADEGEPGTFKDRVLLQQYPGLVIEGMILAAYAAGAAEGTLFLRAEYRYLEPVLEKSLARYRRLGWLGRQIPAAVPFDFDIRIQRSAGAYVCGEETALLNAMEGLRGEPRTKLHYPVEHGFLGRPTIVNNVETFACATRIIEHGPAAFRERGTPASPGTKLISVSGDCSRPGIYEIEWGMPLGELLERCGADQPHIIQVGGPSGTLLPASETHRTLSREDLPCNGSFMVFRKDRDLLRILLNFSDFFSKESCGICTPCRAGNFILHRKLEKLQRSMGSVRDLTSIREWSRTIMATSRCGLGQSAPRPILHAMEHFPAYFDRRVDLTGDHVLHSFDLAQATRAYLEASERPESPPSHT